MGRVPRQPPGSFQAHYLRGCRWRSFHPPGWSFPVRSNRGQKQHDQALQHGECSTGLSSSIGPKLLNSTQLSFHPGFGRHAQDELERPAFLFRHVNALMAILA